MRKTLIPLLLASTLPLVACNSPAGSAPENANMMTPKLPPPHAPAAPSQPKAKSPSNAPPAMLTKMQSLGRIQIAKTFPTEVPELTGYLLKSGNQYHVVYGLHGYLVTGAIASPDGRNLNKDYKNKFAPKPDFASIIKKMDSDPTVFTMGTAGPTLYVFEDPNCIFCHKFEKAAEPLIAVGRLQVKVIMVAFLKSDSQARAAAIMSADDPAEAMRQNTAGYSEATEEGGYPVSGEPDPAMAAVIQRHMNWMRDIGASGTPAILYKNAEGKWDRAAGFPGPQWLESQAAPAPATAPLVPGVSGGGAAVTGNGGQGGAP